MKLLFTLLFLSACKFSLDFIRPAQKKDSEGIQSHDRVTIVSSPLLSKTHLFGEWKDYLIHPKLAFLPQLKIQCQENPRSLTLKFSFDANSEFACEDILKMNMLDFHWKCLSPTQLQHVLDNSRSRARCENLVQFRQLVRNIQIPSISQTLYTSANQKEFLPIPVDISRALSDTLPRLEFVEDASQQSPRSLRVPNFEDWLEQSSDEGAIALVLSPTASAHEEFSSENTFYYLQRFIAQQKEPSKFRLYLNPANPVVSKQKSKSLTPFFVLEEKNSLPSPFSDVCFYVNRWLKAEQILAGLDPKSNPLQSLQCNFEWGEKSLFNPQALTLTKLPFPLVYDSNPGTLIFPFRNLQDTLSADVFRSLKKP